MIERAGVVTLCGCSCVQAIRHLWSDLRHTHFQTEPSPAEHVLWSRRGKPHHHLHYMYRFTASTRSMKINERTLLLIDGWMLPICCLKRCLKPSANEPLHASHPGIRGCATGHDIVRLLHLTLPLTLAPHLAETDGIEQRVVQIQHQQQAPRCQHPREAVRPQALRLAVADRQALVDIPAGGLKSHERCAPIAVPYW